MTVPSKTHKNNAVKNVSFEVNAGEIVCLAGIDGNGQTEFVSALTSLDNMTSGKITVWGKVIKRTSVV